MLLRAILLIATVISTDARAQGNIQYGQTGWESRLYEEVRASDLTLVGAGVSPRHSDDSFALACETRDCASLRLVYFRDRKAYFFGQSIAVTIPFDMEMQTREAVKTLFAKNKGHHRSAHGSMWTLLLIGGGGVALAPITTVPILAVLGISTIVALSGNQTQVLESIDVVGAIRNQFPNSAFRGQQIKAVLTAEGWNWASNPRKISPWRFCDALVQATRPELDSDQAWSQIEGGNGTLGTWRRMHVEECVKDVKR